MAVIVLPGAWAGCISHLRRLSVGNSTLLACGRDVIHSPGRDSCCAIHPAGGFGTSGRGHLLTSGRHSATSRE